MVTTAQLAANAANAKKGGVKSNEGKARVRLNAIVHGLTSKEILLAGEDAETLDNLRQSLMRDLQPEGALETLLADLIVADTWRLKRAVKMETVYLQSSFTWYADRITKVDPAKLTASFGVEPESLPLTLTIWHDMSEKSGLMNLERYRTAIERHLYRSLNELQRLQMARYTGKIAPSLNIQVDMSENN